VLELLSAGERSVGELLPEVGLEASHLSQQLGVLRRAGLVTTRREGKTVFYTLACPEMAELLAVARRILTEVLTGQTGLLRDLQAVPVAAAGGRRTARRRA
jgi:ArsR family transcriptional regulator